MSSLWHGWGWGAWGRPPGTHQMLSPPSLYPWSAVPWISKSHFAKATQLNSKSQTLPDLDARSESDSVIFQVREDLVGEGRTKPRLALPTLGASNSNVANGCQLYELQVSSYSS